MACPQTEDGYVRIANELWDALCRIRIPGEQRQVLDVIIRKTYGFGKKRDGIPLSQFSEMTGISRRNCLRAIDGLLSKKIISVVKKDNKYWNEYEIIKDFDKWKPLSKKTTVLSKKTTGVVKKDNEVLSKKTPSKDNNSKDNVSKDNKKKIKKKNPLKVLANDFDQQKSFEEAWSLYPKRERKTDAMQKFSEQVLNQDDFTRLKTAIMNYSIAKAKTERKYLMQGGTFFNERWQDEEWQEYRQPDNLTKTERRRLNFMKISQEGKTNDERRGIAGNRKPLLGLPYQH